ncbi:uncharacterized protein M421DRAFT_93940 [Didymella exigua CBS 183.55]|uniref:Uncharacterized protein n=1 Tax=Didymella exigua CBS 183.55 TaxID=1150837 RepID=A0A6A5RFZ0_9PLEO|nr:uncharacterized protein M421DRAFT_93940 [Didymella exigua CBS 183.55]KAF1926373.1 hypothetical protein M421DRAFT_93940 [Didymella exigua CBS 183.55]
MSGRAHRHNLSEQGALRGSIGEINADTQIGDDRHPLHEATGIGNVFEIEYQLQVLNQTQWIDVNAVTTLDCTPLHVGAMRGKIDAMQELIKNGATVDLIVMYPYGRYLMGSVPVLQNRLFALLLRQPAGCAIQQARIRCTTLQRAMPRYCQKRLEIGLEVVRARARAYKLHSAQYMSIVASSSSAMAASDYTPLNTCLSGTSTKWNGRVKDGNVLTHSSRNYKHALLTSRNLFPREPGK